VTLATGAPFAPVVPSGAAGTLGNGTIAVTGGSATVANLSYSEVGTFTLTASPATNYLNNTPAVDLNSRVAIFAGPSNARTSLVGRFKPHHFDLSGGTIVNRSDVSAGAGCSPASTFTYMGEPMGVKFTLTPRNAAGGTTTNYRDFGGGVDYSKFSTSKTTTANWTALGSPDSVGLWVNATAHAVSPGSCTVVVSNATPSVTSYACTGVANPASVSRAAGPRVTIAGPGISWSSGGIGSFTANATLERADTLDGPYATLNIGIAPQDSDGVQLLPGAILMDADNSGTSERASVGATSVRYGRLQLQNAYGSELLDLPVPLFAQYWNGSAWAKNSDDSCSAIVAPTSGAGLTFYPNVADNVPGNHLSSTETSATVSTTGKLVAGDANLKLSKPGKDNGGYVDISIALAAQPWLQYRWKGSLNVDPAARATFGIYKSPLIYRRENY
jgi:MSHA biogenesis protein MshQ